MSDAAILPIPGRATLAAEFDRVAVLVRAVRQHRDGKGAGAALKSELMAAQRVVDAARARGAWNAAGIEAALANAPFVADCLAVALYPHVRPSAAYAVQGLMPGATEPAPTQALLHELLMLAPGEEDTVARLLGPASPLVTRSALRVEGAGPLRRIHPGAAVLQRVMGGAGQASLPAAVRLVDSGTEPLAPLVLPPETERRLGEVVALAAHAARRWAEGLPVPGGPAALFVGAPGTGKSLAARHVARRLRLPLYGIELGAVVSKWVGETERNLSRIFEQMSGTDGAIVIDEADALLGKRVTVKEGRDHYVNQTVSHLLMLLERHRGPVVLTSNLRANLDDAYTRRFAAVVEFKRPSAELRRALWLDALRPCPCADPPEEIARRAASIELSAAEIDNAFHLALALAEAEGAGLKLSHAALAVFRELTKSVRTVARADLRELAPFLDEAP